VPTRPSRRPSGGGISHDAGGRNAGLTLATSVILGVIVTVGSLILATRRLSAFAVQGEPA
jgi:hypothetical protein